MSLFTMPNPLDVVREKLQATAKNAHIVKKDAFSVTHEVLLEDGRSVNLRMSNSPSVAPVVQAEICTLKYISEETTIPTPTILASGSLTGEKQAHTVYFISQKPDGIPLDSVFYTLPSHDQTSIVAQIARTMLSLFTHRFSSIGSLVSDADGTYSVGPIVRRPFYEGGRAQFNLDRGPFRTAKAYYLACAQRELDCSRTLFVQSASPSYQKDLEDSNLQVERCVGLLSDLVNRCEGLDDDDPVLAPFSLDIHDIGLKNILVASDDHTRIVAIADWQFVNIHPLWCCARLPTWLRPSLSDGDEPTKSILSTIFRAEIARLDGLDDSTFLHALDATEDARGTLDDLADYDAFRDAFLLLPALENILATLPGQEDVAGLSALLDPSTLPGRVARINLMTRGSNAMLLAMTPPRSPLQRPLET